VRGIIYQNALLYQIAARAMYGRNFRKRYETVAKYIQPGWRVLDICCGDCYLKKILPGTVQYEGRDFNDVFIRYAKKRNINAEYCDIKAGLHEEKKFDCVVMMSSLYHFIPEEDRVMDDMKRAASKRVIISEPIKSLAMEKNAFVSMAAKIISASGGQKLSEMKRFTYEDLKKTFKHHGVNITIEEGKDLIGIFDISVFARQCRKDTE